MSRFFIERPIFAWVVAILISLAGAVALVRLPVCQYPDVAPTRVSIGGSYPGASAQTVQDAVVQIIEHEMTGLDGFMYMTSSSSTAGDFSVDVTFKQGTNADVAQMQAQNKLALAMTLLPAEVQSQGLFVSKSEANDFITLAVYCDDGSLTEGDLGDFASGKLKEAICRVDGVGKFEIWGGEYAMRVWTNPEKLVEFGLTHEDVVSAIREQNIQVAVGKLGDEPAPKGSEFTAMVVAKDRMATVDEFKKILVRTDENGSQIRLADVADVEMGSEFYNFSTRFNGWPAVGMSARLTTGANLLKTNDALKATVDELRPFLPKGAKIAYALEIAPTVRESIRAVIRTLLEAFALVFAVILLFLQRFRATLIPTLTIPVVVLGAFAVLSAAGFSLNVVVLFALTLAIGLLVDDAIVVVENVERLMTTEGLSAKEATVKTMNQIQGALVGVGATISAVFLPTFFFGGSTGVIYRQFAVTIVAAMLMSVFVALTFAPALCASMLNDRKGRGVRRVPWFFRAFNALFKLGADGYGATVGYAIARRKRFLALFVLVVAALARWYPTLPTAFLPIEDQGSFSVQVELPPNASQERTQKILDRVSDYFLTQEKDSVDAVAAVAGFGSAGSSANCGTVYVALKPFDQRVKPGLDVFSVVDRVSERFAGTYEAQITTTVPPSIPELGEISGVNFYLQNRSGVDRSQFGDFQKRFVELARKTKLFSEVWPNSLPDEPQYKLEIDEEKARAFNLNLSDVYANLSNVWGGAYVNDFVDRGRVKKVYAQGAPTARLTPGDFERWFARNNNGKMVPFSAFASGRWLVGPQVLTRFNGVEGVEFYAVPQSGVSSGDAMKKIERLVAELPQGVGLSFSGLSFEERRSGSQTSRIFALALLIVFLCLAALYESWTVPFAVALAVPFGALGAVAAADVRSLANDVFFQIGLLTVMGLSAKNAILIVEFAKQIMEKEGKGLYEATIQASIIRLRPIIMTSAAFALGVLPMAVAHGASSVSQHSLGTCVLGGTVVSTAFSIVFVPIFYVAVLKIFGYRKRR